MGTSLTLGRRRDGGGVDTTPPITFFQSFEEMICSSGLKRSVVVPSFSAEKLICHMRVHHFLTLPWKLSNLVVHVLFCNQPLTKGLGPVFQLGFRPHWRDLIEQ